MASKDGEPGFLRGVSTSPAFLILLIAPFFGEAMSGSTPPLDLLLPWNFAFMAALYGCGALICRELAHRFGLGFSGLMVLGVAYAVWEEALVDRYWFFSPFWEGSGIGTYSVVWHTNALLAVHLTVFHTAISICASVLVVEWLVPRARHRVWVSTRGLILAGLVLAGTPVIYGEFDQRPPATVLGAAIGLLATVVGAAFLVGRRHRRKPTAKSGGRRTRRGLGVLAFSCVAGHWVLTYTVAETGLVWPLGVMLALLPVAVGFVFVPRMAVTGPYGSDGVRVVVGLLSFFVLLDLLVALLGRYDMILSALVIGSLAWWLYTHRSSLQRERGEHPIARS